MQLFKVIPVDEIPDLFAGIPDIFVILSINFVIFQSTEPTFDHHIVGPTAFAVHADFYCILSHVFDVVTAGELTALIRIENFGFCCLECFFQGAQHHRRRQSIIQFPANDAAAVPVDNCCQIDKSMVQFDLCDVNGPGLGSGG